MTEEEEFKELEDEYNTLCLNVAGLRSRLTALKERECGQAVNEANDAVSKLEELYCKQNGTEKGKLVDYAANKLPLTSGDAKTLKSNSTSLTDSLNWLYSQLGNRMDKPKLDYSIKEAETAISNIESTKAKKKDHPISLKVFDGCPMTVFSPSVSGVETSLTGTSVTLTGFVNVIGGALIKCTGAYTKNVGKGMIVNGILSSLTGGLWGLAVGLRNHVTVSKTHTGILGLENAVHSDAITPTKFEL